ncbi:MAG: transcriptional repressor LexA [Candidatus Omnitrophica bacterium]|nr:transcriptional repressor LexA [Candidatus Omnitrophota bacterium]
MEQLTARQGEILGFIRAFIDRHGYPPTVREIGRHFRIQSSSVFDHLEALKRKGHLEKQGFKPRALRIRDDRGVEGPVTYSEEESVLVPIVGRVAAGLPILAEENIEERVPLPQRLVRHKNSFLLRVQGDSMTGSGILDGDHVIVRPQAWANHGDIVVVRMEDEATVKKLDMSRDKIFLVPTNPAYKPMPAKPNTLILGKVVGLIRGY